MLQSSSTKLFLKSSIDNEQSATTQAERDVFLRKILDKQPYTVSLEGLSILVSKDVFPPDLGFTTQHLARHLRNYCLSSALDMGCGTGFLALVLRCNGVDEVWAVDNHKQAIECTLANVKANLTEDAITVVQSDLFSAIPRSKKFELIVFNHPYYPATSETHFGLGYDGGAEIIKRFLTASSVYLQNNGVIIMPYSEIAGLQNDPRRIAENLGFNVSTIFVHTDNQTTHYIYEMKCKSL